MEESVERVEGPTSALPAFPVHHNAAYNERPVEQGVNGFAIAAFVLGLCGMVALSIGFGIGALVQVNNKQQKGRGWAIAGLCLSALWLVVLILLLGH
ncbi:MAG: DUF4190 domain-containing protein [Actinobacteria bacterium]|nr:DUF4190 domain-containing protein [Actinomycetota bacterium]